MIKFSDVALVNPLKIIFTNCLRRGRFPKIWKYANVVPVHKKNEKNVKGNYRPISLLPIFGKILEKLVYDSLYSHLVSHDLLNPNQSGFRPGDSTVNQLISITHSIFKAFDCNPPLDVRSVYLDISKAFDRVWHDGLIFKLKRCGVSGQLLSLLQSFLMDRRQRTVLNGQCSSWGDISAGVPQDSILGPLFFLVYINDLTENLKCNVKLFADDTSLFSVVENSNAAANDMNHDLELIMQWAHDWRMSFNQWRTGNHSTHRERHQKGASRWSSCSTLGLVTRSRKLCVTESQLFSKQSHNILRAPNLDGQVSSEGRKMGVQGLAPGNF